MIADLAIPVVGLYDDTVVRTAAGWRFAHRRFSMSPTETYKDTTSGRRMSPPVEPRASGVGQPTDAPAP